MRKIVFLCSALLLTLTACVDRDWRFEKGEIDTGIGIAPDGIELPIGVIEHRSLGEIFKNVKELSTDHEGFYQVVSSAQHTFHVDGHLLENIVSSSWAASNNILGWQLNTAVFSDLTKALENSSMNLDVVPPTLILSISNSTPVALNGTIYVTVINRAGEASAQFRVDGLHIAASGTTDLCLIAPEGTVPVDKIYTAVTVPELANIMDEIPDRIELSVGATVPSGSSSAIDPSRSYPIEVGYDLKFPLSFGPDMALSLDFNDRGAIEVLHEIADWGVNIADFDLFVEINTSLGLAVAAPTVEFLDWEGRPVEGVAATFIGELGGASPSSTAPTASRMRISIEFADGDMDVLSSVESIHIRIPLTGTASVAGERNRFRPADFFSGRAWVSLPEGVIL